MRMIPILSALFLAAAPAALPQMLPLTEVAGLTPKNVALEITEYKGRQAVRVTQAAPGNAYAIVDGPAFQDGTIEVDIAMEPADQRMAAAPGFGGVVFRGRDDASRFELMYLRPGNAVSQDQAMRNHTAQYTAEPDFGWYKLRRQWPSVYESHAAIEPRAWTRMKIEVAGRLAKLFINGSDQPTLIIDGVKGGDLKGVVALWGYPGQHTYFSNLRVTHAKPLPVTNGSEAAGTWQVQLITDAMPANGKLTLAREGSKLTGQWTGTFGDALPVEGAWRDGYVELRFNGKFAFEKGAPPADVTTVLAGWLDGVNGKGRAKVEGRADGRWTATREAAAAE